MELTLAATTVVSALDGTLGGPDRRTSALDAVAVLIAAEQPQAALHALQRAALEADAVNVIDAVFTLTRERPVVGAYA
jgi:hypothetical protein